MRWHVHCTDAVSGEEVDLAANEPQAEDAIKSATKRRIGVGRLTADRSTSVRRIGIILGCLAITGLAVTCGIFFSENRGLRGTLDQAISEQSRLAQSVTLAEKTVSEIRASGHL